MSNLDEAISYVQRGWSVIPLEVGTKKALVKWKKYQDERPDEAQLTRWWQKWPDANVGIITGQVSGFFAVDIDSPDGLATIEGRGGLPETLQVKTSKVGHYYFQYPETGVRNRTAIVAGVDIRGDGGLVAAPPSIHATGVVYEWANRCEIAVAPDWLIELMQAPKPYETMPEINREHLNGAAQNPDDTRRFVEGCVKSELQKVHACAEGDKNTQILKSSTYLSGYIHTGAITADEIESRLFDAIASRAKDPAQAVQTLRAGIRYGSIKPLDVPAPPKQVLIRGREARAFIRSVPVEEMPETGSDESPSKDEDERVANDGIYAVLNGRTVLSVQKTKTKETGQDENTARHFVCDWAAELVGEVTDEDGNTIFDIEGRTIEGRHFALSLPAENLSNAGLVAGKFLNVVGVRPVLFAGMEKHVVPSMRSFSDTSTAKRIRRFNRVGWTRESEKDLTKREFIMPGMLKDDVDVTGLDNHLAYSVTPPTSSTLSDDAAEALKCLILSQEPKNTLIAVTTAFAAPLSLLCGFQGDKYALFIAGRTGSFKTSFCQILMCLFGDFNDESVLIKFGLGTTANSLQAILTRASHMPVLIDNFKTNTGKGGQDAVSMIQTALEGGEKIRLTRNADIRPTKPINAWLVLTGEDYVEDAASRARSLYLSFAFYGDSNPDLSRAQELADAGVFKQIGGHLLAWALTSEALAVGERIKSQFGARRSHWAKFVKNANKNAVNAYRVASNLAVCEMTWEMLQSCPVIAPHLKAFEPQFREGLSECARAMAMMTAETHEATRYLDALREMIASDRAYLCPRLFDPVEDERRLKLGWFDDKGVYLIPGVAFEAAVKGMVSQGGLSSMSKNALHRQLADQGHIAGHAQDKYTKHVRTGTQGIVQTVLHLKPESLFVDEKEG